jgi:Transglutaminase-like superfamily/Domain of unknown function (DUF4129)
MRNKQKPSLPFYAAALVAHLGSILAVYAQGDALEFFLGIALLSLIGVGVSFGLRSLGRAPEHLLGIVLPVLILVFLVALSLNGRQAATTPIGGNGHLTLVVALLWSATASLFLLWNNETVTFTAVWPLAIIGLMGTVNVNRELIFSFVIYFFAAIFLLVHHAVIGRTGSQGSPKDSLHLTRIHAGLAVLTWGIAIGVGFLVAIPIQMVGRNISLVEMLKRLNAAPTPNRLGMGGGRLSFNNREFRVGLGPVSSGMDEILTVKSPRPHYWRGRTFASYTSQADIGNVWDNSDFAQGDRDVVSSRDSTGKGRFEIPISAVWGEAHQKVTRETHLFLPHNGTVEGLYHAAEPRVLLGYFDMVSLRPDGTPRIDGGGGLAVVSLNRDNSTLQYTIESEISEATPEDLAKSGTQYPSVIRDVYMNRKGGGSDLIVEAIGEAKDPYAKAEAIRRFIATRCMYTLDARAVPAGQDAVDFFLNTSKEGYCDLYASSMAILARHAGLPSRVATGFTMGETDPSQEGQYILRDKDRHAWCEIYFVGYGWVPFDATQDTASALDTQAQVTQPTQKKTFWQQLQESGKIPLILLGLGGLGVAFVLGNELRNRSSSLLFKTNTLSPILERRVRTVLGYYYQATKTTARLGVPRPPHETAREHLATVGTSLGTESQQALSPLVRLVERAIYSPQTLTQEDENQAKIALSQLRTALKNKKR